MVGRQLRAVAAAELVGRGVPVRATVPARAAAHIVCEHVGRLHFCAREKLYETAAAERREGEDAAHLLEGPRERAARERGRGGVCTRAQGGDGESASDGRVESESASEERNRRECE
jgi:hypothetical protein